MSQIVARFPLFLIVLLLITVWSARPGHAVDPPAPQGEANAAEVRAGARGLFVLVGSIGAQSARERAQDANERIAQILSDPALDPQQIQATTLPDGSPGVALGSMPIVEVTYADAQSAGEPPERVAEEWAQILRSNVTQLQPLFVRERATVSVKTLSEHHVLLLILQVAMLLAVARICGEIALRLGQPPVIGQLAAGILLGHSVLGALLPELKALVFPVEATQSYLLEVVSWIGVLFLLMLTGLETDIALIRQQGRPALYTSITGILLPFLLGAGVGYLLPDSLLTTPESRLVLALFLGTVLSVSSVPVIAKILLDMRLLRRNVGQLILAAALAHDTVGWIILAVVASLAASGRVELLAIGKTVLGTVLFGLFSATLGRVLVRRSMRWVNDHMRTEYALLSAVVVLMMLSAAVTQFIGVHAVLGAFVVGILLRETAVVNERVLHPLETVTTAIFAPIFFAAAGLHVNLGVLLQPALLGFAVLITAAACIGKIVGCFFGAWWGGAPFWNAVSVGVGTNARGAMGLIVGILGFSLGILTVDTFSLIIVMAVVTTAISPPLLRWSLRKVQPDPAEEARLQREALRERSFLGRIQRVLLPTRGGDDAQLATVLVNSIAEQQPVEVTSLYVQASPSDNDTAAHRSIKARLKAEQASFDSTTLPPAPPAEAIVQQVRRGYDLLAMGCGLDAGTDGVVFGRLVDEVAAQAAVPLLVVRAPRGEQLHWIRRILVPTSSGATAVQAAELAVAVARHTGAEVIALHVYEMTGGSLFWTTDYEERAREAGQDVVEQVRSLGDASEVRVDTLMVQGERAGPEIARVAREREVDLIILGGSIRPSRRLFLGPTIGTVLRETDCAVAVLSA
ncbi:MAG: cation:proton antiporter [Armatimonadota bacterium]